MARVESYPKVTDGSVIFRVMTCGLDTNEKREATAYYEQLIAAFARVNLDSAVKTYIRYRRDYRVITAVPTLD